MSTRIPDFSEAELRKRVSALRQDQSISAYRRAYLRSLREASRMQEHELRLLTGGGGLITPADLLSADGMWLSPMAGITTDVGVTSWADQIAPAVTFSQTSDSREPALNTSPDRVTFDGSDDYLSAPTASKHQWTQTVYIAGWVRRLNTDAGDKHIWSQWDAGNVEQFIVRDRNDTNLFYTVVAENASTLSTNNFNSLPINTWTFFEVVYDGTNATPADRCEAWFDRVQQTRTGGSGTNPATIHNATANALIGSFQAIAATFLEFDLGNLYTDKVIPDSDTRDALRDFEAPV